VGEESGDKTEEPTPHKLQEARKKGQVVHSKEVTTAVMLLFTYKLFSSLAEKIWYQLVEFGASMFNHIKDIGLQLDIGTAHSLVAEAIWTILKTMFPLLIPVFFATIIVSMLQTQFLFSSESMKPELSKLDPMKGLKRIFSLKGMIQILITIVKIALVALITYSIIKNHLDQVINAMTMDPFSIMVFVAQLIMEIAMKVGLFYLGLAILDYFYQRYEFFKSMKMTKHEVKEEYKRLEGDPLIKQAQRQKQREMAQKRQRKSVPGADVVVTNPVHLACAIRYKPEIDKAPVLLAKGQRLFAEEIKKIAEEQFIPIVENESLARGIYNSTEAGEEVPPDLYRAVAEVLAFVYKLGRNKHKQRNKPVVDQR
jgi:flagellar biosynthetic protein FlhB